MWNTMRCCPTEASCRETRPACPPCHLCQSRQWPRQPHHSTCLQLTHQHLPAASASCLICQQQPLPPAAEEGKRPLCLKPPANKNLSRLLAGVAVSAGHGAICSGGRLGVCSRFAAAAASQDRKSSGVGPPVSGDFSELVADPQGTVQHPEPSSQDIAGQHTVSR